MILRTILHTLIYLFMLTLSLTAHSSIPLGVSVINKTSGPQSCTLDFAYFAFGGLGAEGWVDKSVRPMMKFDYFFNPDNKGQRMTMSCDIYSGDLGKCVSKELVEVRWGGTVEANCTISLTNDPEANPTNACVLECSCTEKGGEEKVLHCQPHPR